MTAVVRAPTGAPEPAHSEAYAIDVVDNAIAVLTSFLDDDYAQQGLSDISRRLGLHKSLIYRLLTTLQQGGYVVQDPATKRYRLGWTLARLGRAAQQRFEVQRLAAPMLSELARSTGESTFLVVRNGASAICLDRHLSQRGTTFFARIGGRLPYHACSSGKLLLAYMAEAQVDAIIAAGLTRYAAKTVTNRLVLRKQLSQIRAAGYAITEDELDPAITSIASAIRNPAGEVVAAISVAGPTIRFPNSIVDSTLARVLATARAVSRAWSENDETNHASANGVNSNA
jgi:IclR family KDG regulon transcriptional repressor